jgi:hypothetical protein
MWPWNTAKQLKALTLAVDSLRKEIHAMANILDALEAEVAKVTAVEQSAVVLLTGLSQQLKDAVAANDSARLQAVIDALDAKTAALAAAVAANTLAAPPAAPPVIPPVEPPPPPPDTPGPRIG